MSGFIEGEDRHQATLFPERLDDFIADDSAVRVSLRLIPCCFSNNWYGNNCRRIQPEQAIRY
jgi:hypothetical protein